MSYEINEEMEQFAQLSELELQDIDNPSSIKTNFTITQQNKNTLLIWVNKLKEYAVYIKSLIDIDEITNLVLSNLRDNKTQLLINFNLTVGGIVTNEVNGIIYRIERIDSKTIQITAPEETNWEVFGLIIQVKNEDGVVVNPVIESKDSEIKLYFNDGILTNYYLLMM